jgi:multidrug resistance efflux pump
MQYEIESEIDLMVARVQAERGVAEGILQQAREEEDYYREKVAAKLVAFLDAEEAMVKLYAEAKQYYKPVAATLESRRPYLSVMYQQAVSDWERALEGQRDGTHESEELDNGEAHEQG